MANTLKSVAEAHLAKLAGKKPKKPRKPKEPIVGVIRHVEYNRYYLLFELKALPPLPNADGYSKSHWAVQAGTRKRWREAVKNLLMFAKPSLPLWKARLTFTRFSASRPDSDGLAASFKSVRDGLIDAGVIVDDKYEVVGDPRYRWQYSNAGDGYVSVEVSTEGL